jgi:hypothetical protein
MTVGQEPAILRKSVTNHQFDKRPPASNSVVNTVTPHRPRARNGIGAEGMKMRFLAAGPAPPHPKSPSHRNRLASFSKRSGPASG